jgi:hypothetical protein
MRWYLYTDRSVYVLSYDALIGRKDTVMASLSLFQFRQIEAQLALQTRRAEEFIRELTLNSKCHARYKVCGNNYSIIWVEIYPHNMNEGYINACQQFTLEIDLHTNISKVEFQPNATSDEFLIIAPYVNCAEAVLLGIA